MSRFRWRNRRGAILMMMMLLTVVFVGLAAFSVDFSRMYLYRTQLHLASDAGALAAGWRLAKEDNLNAANAGVTYAQMHPVDGVTPTVSASDMEPGFWDFATSTFTPATGVSPWTTPALNAVRATTRYNANYSFGRIFGATTRARTGMSVAAIGYVGATECVRPIALPYEKLLEQLYGPGGQDPLTYNLTDDDVDDLAAATVANEVQLKVGDANSTVVSGSFYAVKMGPYAHAPGNVALSPGPTGGANVYSARLGNACSNLTHTVGPGDWLEGEQGNMQGPTAGTSATDGVRGLCGMGNISSPGDYDCNPDVSIKMAVWSQEGQPPVGGCNPKCFKVKYIGVFVITRYTKASGSTPDGIWGYFSTLASSGAFTTTPTPLKKVILVQ